MNSKVSRLGLLTAVVASMSCAQNDNRELAPGVEGSSSGSSGIADTWEGPEGPGLGSAGGAKPIVEGFAVSITKPGNGTVLLTWADQGVAEYEVWSSDDAYFSPADAGSTMVDSGPDESFSAAMGATAYYRVRATGAVQELSTTVGQIHYDLFTGYTKMGVCLVSDLLSTPELRADMPSEPNAEWLWDPQLQQWINGGIYWQREMTVGGVVSVQHNVSPSPDEYTWVGHVPTATDVSIGLVPGDNVVATLPLRFGATMASDVLAAVPGATRIGVWDASTQVLQWHPDDGDWLLEPCSPIHLETTENSVWPPPPVDDGLPPDPSEVAPPLDSTVDVPFFEAVRFLFEGEAPIQQGVAPGTIEVHRVAVLRGVVRERDGGPLGGAEVTVLDHPEYGSTLSRADGRFDIAVNGGGPLVLSFAATDMLSAQRTARAPWQGFVEIDEVALVALDSEVSIIDFDAPIEVHVATEVTDAAGTRNSALMFREGTVATMILPNGSSSVLPSISVRATEYTVGDDGPAAMPGNLPPTSAYTYAAEYSVDEAIAAGAERVEFDPPAISYTTNFLDFPVGSPVPVGAYDRSRAAWMPEPNGIVVAIVGETGGLADIDLTGDGTADPGAYAGAGIDADERTSLAELYDTGDELWRVQVEHFTPWDCNWPWGPPPDAEGPPDDEPVDPEPDPRSCRSSGSVLECQSQVLGEGVPIAGTPFSLQYRSDRVPGRTASYTLDLGAIAASLPPSLERINMTVEVGGRVLVAELTPSPGEGMSITWDGVDAHGRRPQGPVSASLCVGYVYPGSYEAPNGPTAFGLPGTTVISADTERFEATFTRCFGRDRLALLRGTTRSASRLG